MRWAVVLLAGCGRIAFDPLETTPDTATGGATGCWPAWMDGSFSPSPPRRLDELVTGSPLSDPSLSSDGLTLYYVTAASGNSEVARATRTALRAPWTPAGVIAELSNPNADTKLTLAANGQIGIFASARGGADFELYMVTRPDATSAFATPTKTHVTALETTRDEFDPHISSDGLRIYWAPIKATGGQHSILASRASVTDDFAIERMLDEINDSADPALSPDELVITMSFGGPSDILYATRASTSDPFGTRQPLPVINSTTGHDVDAEMTADGCEIFFASNRAGTREIYTAIMVP
jgi:Tol biopolymer transport system component